jgi:dihydrodipicolinate synthase/N-acetylneuraminate lyase
MERLGLIDSGLAREPLAPLSEAARTRVESLLAGSPHVDLPAVAVGA